MEKILFRGAKIRHFDGRQEEGGAFVRIHMTADFSKPVIDKMEWEDPGASATETKLDGELAADSFILTPGDKSMAASEIQFAIRSVQDFKMVRVKDGEESTHRELRFVVRTSAGGVAGLVDEYLRTIGDHKGALRISYNLNEQADLPLEKEAAE